MRESRISLTLLVLALVASGCGHPSGRSVVLIVVDTLRADHLGAYGYERETSPKLDAWTESGRLYEFALSTSPWTLPAVGSLLTGRLLARHGAGAVVQSGATGGSVFQQLGPLDTEVATLAEILDEQGYATGAIVTSPFLSTDFRIERCFRHYDHTSGDGDRHRRADEVIDRALAWIDLQGSTPFFLLVHIFDLHIPYDAPAPFRGRFTTTNTSRLSLPVSDPYDIRARASQLAQEDREFIVAAYDEELAFVDEQIARLRAGLAERAALDESLVVLTSDHGEEFFEHDGFEHGHAMWQELLHVPLVFWGDDVRPGRESTPVSLVDVAPTILEALELPVPDEMEGVSLWGNLSRSEEVSLRTQFAEGNLYGAQRRVALRWPYKLDHLRGTNRGRLFDLEKDPSESVNIGADRPRVTTNLLREAGALLDGLEAQRTDETAELDAEAIEHLRALGYGE